MGNKPISATYLLYSGNEWTDDATRALLPFVIQQALWVCKPLEYGDLNRHGLTLGRKSVLPIAYRYVAGRIGDICRLASDNLGPPRVPPLNIVIINKTTRLPSHGVDSYLAAWRSVPVGVVKHLSENDRADWVKAAQEEVWSYPRSPEFCDLLEIATPHAPAGRAGKSVLRKLGTYPGGGQESQAHKTLKVWVAEHPELFSGYGTFGPGKNEVKLYSGDEVDVLF